MQQLIIMIHIVLCLALIALVLLQQGKGASMGPAFGSGASNTLFGSRGPASFLMKVTGTIAALFFVTSLSLSFFISQSVHHASNLTLAAPVSGPAVSLPASSKQKSAPATPPLAPVQV